jgi:signal transduction histidine kinase
LFPLLVWAATRFGLRGATTGTFLVAVISVWGTARHLGPFGARAAIEGLLPLQLFVAVVAITMLALGAATAERKRALQTRDEVLAMVSHDLRNPLGVITLSATALQHRLTGDAERRPIAAIERATARMGRLVRDLLDLAALDAGQLALDREPHDAGPLLEQAAEALRPLADERGVGLRVEPSPMPLRVTCDHERVLQVFANLGDNALKFTPRGGTITLRSEHAGSFVRFSVSDTGSGMSPDQLDHAFERYWRAAPRDRRGVGLGLAITKGLVEAQGGAIGARSAVGAGSTFFFMLPVPSRRLRARSVRNRAKA